MSDEHYANENINNSNLRKRKLHQMQDLTIDHSQYDNNDNPTKRQRITQSKNEYHLNHNTKNNSNNNNDNFEDKYFDEEFEFDEDNDCNWSDDGDLISDNLTCSYVSSNESQTKTVSRTPFVQCWSCTQCNQLNNLKDTFSKYKMKCFRCDNLYSVQSKVIPIPFDPIEQSVWKCPQCTFLNKSNVNQCEMCECNKPVEPETTAKDKQHELTEKRQLDSKYCDKNSNDLVKGYLRAMANINRSRNLCPINSTIPDVLAMIVLLHYQFCHFWNQEYTLRKWEFKTETKTET
eukprot:286032_1